MVKTKELDNFTRNQIMHELLSSVNSKGKPAHGIINDMGKYVVNEDNRKDMGTDEGPTTEESTSNKCQQYEERQEERE